MDVLAKRGAEIAALPAGLRAELADEVMRATASLRWVPNPGPQTEAYFSAADVLLYGGEPGGGKSQLILGLAFNCHRRSLIMRREYGDLERLIEDALTIHGSRNGFNGSPPPRLRISKDQVISFRAAQRIGDEQKTMGQGRDLLGVDEATHFTESQIHFLMGWVRTEVPGQRCRTVLATNPPLTAEGMWVNKMFAPWIDPTYPKPARPGELRWVISDEDGNDEWVDGPDDMREVRGKLVRPMSRSYIPASVKDNPFYAGTDYERRLDNMKEPFRSILLGGFQTTFKDQDRQVIPTAWIKAAQERWKPDGWRKYYMTAMALDPAGGGRDAAEIMVRHGGWFGEPVTKTGADTADGSVMAGEIFRVRKNACAVVVDVGGGYGGSVMLRLADNEVTAARFNGSSASSGVTKDGNKLRFWNKRAEAWWRMREALDPEQEGGSPIDLPPSAELRADLAAPTFEIGPRGIKVEDKDAIRERLGRSPGKGDAAVMCLSEGDRAVERALRRSTGQLKANLGHENVRRHYR